jgi:hypothetical protein
VLPSATMHLDEDLTAYAEEPTAFESFRDGDRLLVVPTAQTRAESALALACSGVAHHSPLSSSSADSTGSA